MEIGRRKALLVRAHLPRHTIRCEKKRSAPPPPPMTQFMKYGVPPLLSLLTLQLKPDALFGKNPAPVWSFIAATAVYWLIIGAIKSLTSKKWLRRAALASGILSAISMFSMFIPYPVSLLPLLIWVPLVLPLAWPKPFTQQMECVKSKIQALLVLPTRVFKSTIEPPILPV